MQVDRQLVTPEIAKSYLSHNDANREVRQSVVEYYARQMKEGSWKSDTGEMIKFSKKGRLLDGQHRLMAVVLCGTPVWLHVAKGLSDDIFDVLDTGSVRSANDVFLIGGVKNASRLPSIIAMYDKLKDFEFKHCRTKKTTISNQEMLHEYKTNQPFWDDVHSRAMSWYKKFANVLIPSQIGGLFAVLTKVNPTKADEFFSLLCTGVGSSHLGISIVRSKLIKDKVAQFKMPTSHKLALIIKAWNLFISGKDVKQLVFNPEKESFPMIAQA